MDVDTTEAIAAGALMDIAERAGAFLDFQDRLRELAAANTCLLYTSDAADDLLCVDLGGRRIIKKKKNNHTSDTSIHP